MGTSLIFPVTGPGTGPTEPHSSGVAGATHRWIPGLHPGAGDGVSIPAGTAFADLIGDLDLVTSGANTAPLFDDAGAPLPVMQWANSPHIATSAFDVAAPFTFSIVGRSANAGLFLGGVDGYRLAKAGDGSFMLGGDGNVTLAGSTAWVVMIAVCDGASSRLTVNGTTTANAGSITAPHATTLANLAQIGPQGTASDMTVAEMTFWPRALDATERAAHVAAMDTPAAWGALL